MKIGIFGGSFNPVHRGHISVAEHAIKHLSLDKLIFVPAFKSPFKSKVKYVDGQHRIQMLEIAKPQKATISHFEINRKSISYTIDTVKYFKQKYPNDELFLIIGSDNIHKLNKWKSINEIVEMLKIVVFRRDNEFSKLNIKRYGCILIDNPIYDFSSTWFRKGHMHNVDKAVMKYISSQYLYIPELMKNMLDHKRYQHSKSVASYAAKFAKSAGVNSKKAWVAGSLHDITKSWSFERHKKFLINQDVDITNIKDFQLHSMSGYYWLKNKYMMEDEEIMKAVLRHTSLADELSMMDKVIFAADKMCDGRRHPGIQNDRELIMKNFDVGFKKIIGIVYELLIKMNRDFSDEEKAIYERWK
ncbi:nicotinate-nucleotide adenylyltransferase [Candidatus Mycoplasma mahonii]|uniref:nicotinate-nucleotide adenylyltransferase n=1 Tax=Candidatus Mycoplasma mahonii TaxID=3004105 RepID=UPI0026EE6E0A|nr:nicotinate-nucleotide adenylyltransferase [Candidatus Mycoplasma mahonii]WKX02199.1 nicotinate-nucleotide adenylyltransferase [Candidatus Mycoplasma mahonii]